MKEIYKNLPKQALHYVKSLEKNARRRQLASATWEGDTMVFCFTGPSLRLVAPSLGWLDSFVHSPQQPRLMSLQKVESNRTSVIGVLTESTLQPKLRMLTPFGANSTVVTAVHTALLEGLHRAQETENETRQTTHRLLKDRDNYNSYAERTLNDPSRIGLSLRCWGSSGGKREGELEYVTPELRLGGNIVRAHYRLCEVTATGDIEVPWVRLDTLTSAVSALPTDREREAVGLVHRASDETNNPLLVMKVGPGADDPVFVEYIVTSHWLPFGGLAR